VRGKRMADRYKRANQLSEKKFKRLVGVKKKIFERMMKVLSFAYAEKHKKGGRNPKLELGDQLMLTLSYWRQYITYEELGFDYEVSESTAHEIVEWVENILIQSRMFSLPGKKALIEDRELKIVLLDVMESPIERPKKNESKKTTIQEKRKDTQ
jgi:hypothetical protein